MAKARSKTSSKLRLQKIPVQAYLEPEQAKALKELSDRTQVPQQVYIREGIDLALDKHAKDDVFQRFIDRRLRRAIRERKS